MGANNSQSDYYCDQQAKTDQLIIEILTDKKPDESVDNKQTKLDINDLVTKIMNGELVSNIFSKKISQQWITWCVENNLSINPEDESKISFDDFKEFCNKMFR